MGPSLEAQHVPKLKQKKTQTDRDLHSHRGHLREHNMCLNWNKNPQRTEMITVMGAIFGSTACAQAETEKTQTDRDIHSHRGFLREHNMCLDWNKNPQHIEMITVMGASLGV